MTATDGVEKVDLFCLNKSWTGGWDSDLDGLFGSEKGLDFRTRHDFHLFSPNQRMTPEFSQLPSSTFHWYPCNQSSFKSNLFFHNKNLPQTWDFKRKHHPLNVSPSPFVVPKKNRGFFPSMICWRRGFRTDPTNSPRSGLQFWARSNRVFHPPEKSPGRGRFLFVFVSFCLLLSVWLFFILFVCYCLLLFVIVCCFLLLFVFLFVCLFVCLLVCLFVCLFVLFSFFCFVSLFVYCSLFCLCCLVCLFCLFCFVLFCFVLFCFVCLFVCLFWFGLFCFVLFCLVLFCLFCFVLFCFVLFCFVCLFVCTLNISFSKFCHNLDEHSNLLGFSFFAKDESHWLHVFILEWTSTHCFLLQCHRFTIGIAAQGPPDSVLIQQKSSAKFCLWLLLYTFYDFEPRGSRVFLVAFVHHRCRMSGFVLSLASRRFMSLGVVGWLLTSWGFWRTKISH